MSIYIITYQNMIEHCPEPGESGLDSSSADF